jgi:hypothetical protein
MINFREGTKRKGKYFIQVKNIKTGIIDNFEINNIISAGALAEMAGILNGDSPDIEIKYLAVGDDDTAVTGNETTLVNETFRTAVATLSIVSNTIVQSTFTILNTEAVGTIEEIGIFCGSTAGAGADTGLLLSRILWSKTKTADEEISIVRQDSIERG